MGKENGTRILGVVKRKTENGKREDFVRLLFFIYVLTFFFVMGFLPIPVNFFF